MSMNGKWYGFDVDGTIADNSAHTFGMRKIGSIIPSYVTSNCGNSNIEEV